MLTYGDGLSNVDINKLVRFHNKKKKLNVTAVRPPARFGAIKIKNSYVRIFREKNSLDEGWINGGFFVIEPKFIKYIKSDRTFLEREPFEIITKKKQLVAFKHKGFWQCMDTLRDKEILEKKLKIKIILKKNKILITGATGFIGYHLAKRCLKLKFFHSVLINLPPNKRRLNNVKYIRLDISKEKNLKKKLFMNYDYIVNLAGYVDHSNKAKTMKSHFNGCKNLAKFFLNRKIKKFIQIGSGLEYGKLKSPQIESKNNFKKLILPMQQQNF